MRRIHPVIPGVAEPFDEVPSVTWSSSNNSVLTIAPSGRAAVGNDRGRPAAALVLVGRRRFPQQRLLHRLLP